MFSLAEVRSSIKVATAVPLHWRITQGFVIYTENMLSTFTFAGLAANVFLKYNQEVQNRVQVPSGFRYSNFYSLINI